MICARADVETFSAAGYDWDEARKTWVAPPGASQGKKGIKAVGAHAYAEHDTTEVLLLRYQLPGQPMQRWNHGDPPPWLLLRWLADGGLIEFHNAFFERGIWHWYFHKRLGWPELPFYQVRCSQAQARVNTFPPALGMLGTTLGVTPKDKEGDRLIKKFSVPQKPTKNQPYPRIFPWDDPEDFERFGTYCEGDVITETEASTHPRMAPLSPAELDFWLIDQEINWRGLGINRAGVNDCIAVYEMVRDKLFPEFARLTGGLAPTQVGKAADWLRSRRVPIKGMTEEDVTAALKLPLIPPDARRVLEIRSIIGSASVKKLYSIRLMANSDDRLRGLMLHHGARTGRPTGSGAQPLNMPKAGPEVFWCESCDHHSVHPTRCEWCFTVRAGESLKAREWPGKGGNAPADALEIMSYRDVGMLEDFFGDAVLAVQGCLRSLFCAAPGHVLMCSDYSSIEAVVMAFVAGEEWRMQAFRENKPMYLLSAAKITGTTLETYLEYAKAQGKHHPDRQDGKTAELALQYGGWIGAWLAFDGSGRRSDDEIKKIILRWRDESPAIVELWGGQTRARKWEPFVPELYGAEGAFVTAIMQPGVPQRFRMFSLCYHADVDKLLVTLPSGRDLTYRSPRLTPDPNRPGNLVITYWTYNTNVKYGPIGEVCMNTYGGKLAENWVQAIAHDILRHGIRMLRAHGYPTVLHVYDEIIVEVRKGFGSVAEVEKLMGIMPPFAQGWPIFAPGGWMGEHYRKG